MVLKPSNMACKAIIFQIIMKRLIMACNGFRMMPNGSRWPNRPKLAYIYIKWLTY